MTSPQVVQYIGVAAAPGYAAIGRAQALNAAGAAGTQAMRDIVGYDRGDPGRSFTGDVPTAPSAAAAVAGSAIPPTDLQFAPAEFSDAAINNPDLASLKLIQYQRLSR